MNVVLRPFQISVEDAVLADLAARLERRRLPDLAKAAKWSDGCNLPQFSSFLEYWQTGFNWRAFEVRVNKWPQFMASVDSAEIHFFRITTPGEGPVVPLVMLHGWPGSFVELLGVAERLAASGQRVRFEVVIPSLPGFGFSRRPLTGEMSTFRTADLLAALMQALGFCRFLIQGGDFGAGVGSALALRHPERVLGLHLNYVPGSYRPTVPESSDLDPAERAFLKEREDWSAREGAYSHVHGTRPHALSIGLHDSPAGLAAWILEKFASWSDCNGQLDRLPAELLAANLTLYWATGSLASSIEFYRDGRRHPFHLTAGQRIHPPCAIAHFPREIPLPPRQYVERGYNVTRWTEMPRGGHFAALEEPDLLANDVRSFYLGLAGPTSV